MEHETAVQLKATERYFLGELTGDDRDGFEEHFFTCPDCAEDVRAMSVFAANAKSVFRENLAPALIPSFLSSKALWLSVVVNVALMLGLGYALLKVTPQLRREVAQATAPQFVQDVPVLGLSRG